MARIPSGDTPGYPSSPSYSHPPTIHTPPNPMASQGNGLWHPNHPQMAYQVQQGPQGPPYGYVGIKKDNNWANTRYTTSQAMGAMYNGLYTGNPGASPGSGQPNGGERQKKTYDNTLTDCDRRCGFINIATPNTPVNDGVPRTQPAVIDPALAQRAQVRTLTEDPGQPATSQTG